MLHRYLLAQVCDNLSIVVSASKRSEGGESLLPDRRHARGVCIVSHVVAEDGRNPVRRTSHLCNYRYVVGRTPGKQGIYAHCRKEIRCVRISVRIYRECVAVDQIADAQGDLDPIAHLQEFSDSIAGANVESGHGGTASIGDR